MKKFLITSWLLLSPMFLFAVQEQTKQPQWYEKVAGVLAIPAAIIGLVYSFILIKKTNIETKRTNLDLEKTQLDMEKIKLEIKEKQVTLGIKEEIPSNTPVEIVARNNIINAILFRFIILSLIIQLWSMFSYGYEFLIKGMLILIAEIFTLNLDDSTFANVLFLILKYIPDLAILLVSFGIGLPLAKDIDKALNLKSIFFPWSKTKKPNE